MPSHPRFSWMKPGVACVVATLLFSCNIAAHALQPNILFIYADDQAAWSVGCYGNPEAPTPNLDRLAAQGALFANAFVTTPVCSPSRAGLMCSRYGSEVGIWDWIKPPAGAAQPNDAEIGLDPAIPTWPRKLKEAGYVTALFGKWHLGAQDRFLPNYFGYDFFLGVRSGQIKNENPVLEQEGQERSFSGFATDILTDEAIQWIKTQRGKTPFLLSLHFRAPHAPYLPVGWQDWNEVRNREFSVPNPQFPNLDSERVGTLLREYFASIREIDRNVGRLLAAIDELGLGQDTLVAFTSDHGYNIGHHGLLHKGNAQWITKEAAGKPVEEITRPNMFDTSLRVPLIVRWPARIRAGQRIERVVTNLDWFPTLCAAAGLEVRPEEGVRGRNWLPLVCGEVVEWQDIIYGEYGIRHYARAELRMIRTPEWKLIRDFLNSGRDELYHLAADPEETRNLIADGAFQAERERLEAALDAHRKAIEKL